MSVVFQNVIVGFQLTSCWHFMQNHTPIALSKKLLTISFPFLMEEYIAQSLDVR